MKIAVYTCTFEDYDLLFPPLRLTEGCDYIRVSDKPAKGLRVWRHMSLPDHVSDMPDNQRNRYCKINVEDVLPDYDMSIYLDGNIRILSDLTPLIDEFVASDADIALFPHNERASIETEIPKALAMGKVPEALTALALEQLEAYRRVGAHRTRLTVNGILFRRHGRTRLKKAMDLWWHEMQRYVMRDQFSLPYVIHQTDVRVHYWSWCYFREQNRFFHLYDHMPASRVGPISRAILASKGRANVTQFDGLVWNTARTVRDVLRTGLGKS